MGSACEPRSPSWCACPKSATSPASKPLRSLGWPPTTVTAAMRSERATSKEAVSVCAQASTMQDSQQPSIGTTNSRPPINASPQPESPTSYRHRYDEDGLAGLVDRRLGKASVKRVPIDKIVWMLGQYRTHHMGWNVKHFHEHLRRQHDFGWGYTWTNLQFPAAEFVYRSARARAHQLALP